MVRFLSWQSQEENHQGIGDNSAVQETKNVEFLGVERHENCLQKVPSNAFKPNEFYEDLDSESFLHRCLLHILSFDN